MDRWKSTARKKLRHGESQKGQDKMMDKMQESAKRSGKSRITEFFQCFVALGGSKR